MLLRSRHPAAASPAIHYVDRASGQLRTEVVMGDALVRYVYERLPGRMLRRSVLTRPFFSKVYGRYQSSARSLRSVSRVISDLSIDMDDYVVPEGGFASFNDFFVRRLRPGARPVSPDPLTLVSPSDGRLFAFANIEGDTLLPAKGRHISLARLLGGQQAARPFSHGAVLIARLCPSDYHRFHFPCAATAGSPTTLPGPLESVNPYALARGHAILDTNQRDLTYLESPVFGRIAYLEIGAMCVGRIVHTFTPGPVAAGAEKGFFKFGGSTVIIVFESGRLQIDDDLLAATKRGLETLVKMGERVGRATAR